MMTVVSENTAKYYSPSTFHFVIKLRELFSKYVRFTFCTNMWFR